jgi:fucose 4-O-acetylase-like acetyltransferase
VYWIDVLRAASIALIVFGHIDRHAVTLNLGLVRVPMFFFISGLLVSPRLLAASRAAVTEKYVRSLIVPYVFFGLVTYAVWLVLNLRAPTEAYFRFGPFHSLIGLLYGISGPARWIAHNEALWFLTCLFVVHHLFHALFSRLGTPVRTMAGSVGIGCVGYALLLLLPFRLPWNLEIAMMAVVFYAAGHAVREWDLNALLRRRTTASVALALGSACFALAVFLNGPADMNMGRIGLLPLFYLGGMAGILAAIVLAQRVPRFTFVEVMARNTLVILGLQLPLYDGLKRIFLGALETRFQGVSDTWMYSVTATTIVISICLLLARPLRRFVPWAVGVRGQERPVGHALTAAS